MEKTNFADRYRALKRELEYMEKSQLYCDHVWGAPEYYPEKREIYDYEDYKEGSDIGTIYISTGKYEYIDRYRCFCKKCGKEDIFYPESRYRSR